MMLTPNQHQTDITITKVDIPMLREQREALLATIEDVEDLSTCGDSETMKFRKKQIENLDGIVSLLNAMLDIAEGHE